MKLVELEFVLDAPREEVEEKLTPTAIVEYVGTYDVVSVEESGPVDVLTVAAPNDLEGELAFTELEGGYAYEQGAVGPFESMTTWVTLENVADGTDRTRISVRSEYTFGGPLAFIKDRLASSTRRQELERLVYALAHDLDASDADRDDDRGAVGSDDGTGGGRADAGDNASDAERA
ncbi:hypothetical protein [Natronobeatus ordinarius]|uniref:hypothetical protein n=1 Tax=Natronobeatus ordinarius TaxID=2963433 RepID=UPI0020CE395E|nr:hypothetical protein [Natronobeatus ordinarius]